MHRLKRYRATTPGVAWLLANLQLESPYGREALKNLQPVGSVGLEKVSYSLSELSTIVDFVKNNPNFVPSISNIFKGLRNINGSLDNIDAQVPPAETELLEIKNFAMLVTSLSHVYDQSGLQLASIEFIDVQPVIKTLNPDNNIISSFHIHEAYSDRLKQLRLEKKRLETAILNTPQPLQKDALRSERALLVQHEKDEEFNIRIELGKRLQSLLPQLRHNATMVGQFELLLAKAQLALTWPSCCPRLLPANCGTPMVVKDAINPEIAEILARQGKNFTPVSLEVIRGTTLVTGANMGGKSVALMTVAMNAELASLGFFVFASEFSMPLFDFIYLITGDSQNLSSGLSSFGAEMIKLSELTSLTRKGIGLAICDEFARSTNPSEGSRFVQALSEFLQKSGSYGIIATHYDGIDTEGAAFYQVIGLKNKSTTTSISTAPDRSTVLHNLCANMDYRLVKLSGHYEVPKDALHIATILETDPLFLNILKKYYL